MAGQGETPGEWIENTLKATLSKKLVLVGAKRKALRALFALAHLDKCDSSMADQLCFEVAELFTMNHEVLKALFTTVVRKTSEGATRASSTGEDGGEDTVA